MSAVKTMYEQRSILPVLETYLTTKGWTNITYSNGNSGQDTITNPQIVVSINPGSPVSLQIGKSDGEDLLYRRSMVINAYMETDERASAMVDTLISFIEFMCVDILDHQGSYQGYIQCADPDSIVGQVFSPIMNNPKFMRYRGAVTSPMEAFYPNG